MKEYLFTSFYSLLYLAIGKFSFFFLFTFLEFSECSNSMNFFVFQQYWFTSESVNVIANALITNRCDGVLCIGAPTLFEHFRCSAQRRMSMKSFLLDFDCRFVSDVSLFLLCYRVN